MLTFGLVLHASQNPTPLAPRRARYTPSRTGDVGRLINPIYIHPAYKKKNNTHLLTLALVVVVITCNHVSIAAHLTSAV